MRARRSVRSRRREGCPERVAGRMRLARRNVVHRSLLVDAAIPDQERNPRRKYRPGRAKSPKKSVKPSHGHIAASARRTLRSDAPLADREIRHTGETDFAGAPRLTRRPFDRVVVVVSLVLGEQIAGSVGAAVAAQIEINDGVTARDPHGRIGGPPNWCRPTAWTAPSGTSAGR